jgi:hypothetical protein
MQTGRYRSFQQLELGTRTVDTSQCCCDKPLQGGLWMWAGLPCLNNLLRESHE